MPDRPLSTIAPAASRNTASAQSTGPGIRRSRRGPSPRRSSRSTCRDYQIERLLHGQVRADLAVLGGGDLHAGPAQNQPDELPVRIAVFHQEHADAGKRGQDSLRLRARAGYAVRRGSIQDPDTVQRSRGNRHRKGAPLAHLAGDCNSAAQGLGNAPADRQPQARAAERRKGDSPPGPLGRGACRKRRPSRCKMLP